MITSLIKLLHIIINQNTVNSMYAYLIRKVCVHIVITLMVETSLKINLHKGQGA